jgi:Type I restriction modification DNA specificity domain
MRKQLSNIASFRTGFQFRGRFEPDPTGEIAVIQIKDIDEDRRFRLDKLDRVQMDSRTVDAYRVQQGDVLFLSRGHRLLCTPIDVVLRNTITTNYFFIITPKTEVVQYRYLAWYLNQPEFQAELRPFVRGSHMPLVSRTDLEGLWIEIPNLETQDFIVALDELYRQEQRLLGEVQKKRAKLIHAVSMNAARTTQ